ncbi:aminoglycoside phosphotransferase family protein [Curtobacterium sp. RRHDQ10]|uniref:aminoglycoside phosphotransferase family protein n=1 Tax=Curtobacterium phyllosphaerae TaxID=3413379 RepID=UPI003BF41CFB
MAGTVAARPARQLGDDLGYRRRVLADIAVTEDLVRALLRDQHPDLAALPLRIVASGWDNVVLRLGDDLAVRVPRREVAAHLVDHEQRWLPVLGDLVRGTVPVPTPVRIGVPTPEYPWHWSVVPWFDGQPAIGTDAERPQVVDALAAFVIALHVPAPPDAPHNPVRGGPLAGRADVVAERLASGAVPHADGVSAVWARALAAPPYAGPPVWLHGDLHPHNLVVSDGRLAAVVDFGDVTAGDPATDFATAWLTTNGREARGRFRASVTADDATWMRARGWAVTMATAVVVATRPGDGLHVMGLRAIDALLDDPSA